MHYCDVTNLSGRSRKHNPPTPTSTRPRSVHYKSLVIGLLLCRQVLLSGGAPWAPWRSRRGDPSHLVWVAQVCYPRASALFFLKGRPAGRAVDQRTSQRATTLPVKLGRPSSVRSATLRAFEAALPLLPLLFHVFVRAVSSWGRIPSITISQTAPDLTNHRVTCHLGLSSLLWRPKQLQEGIYCQFVSLIGLNGTKCF